MTDTLIGLSALELSDDEQDAIAETNDTLWAGHAECDNVRFWYEGGLWWYTDPVYGGPGIPVTMQVNSFFTSARSPGHSYIWNTRYAECLPS